MQRGAIIIKQIERTRSQVAGEQLESGDPTVPRVGPIVVALKQIEGSDRNRGDGTPLNEMHKPRGSVITKECVTRLRAGEGSPEHVPEVARPYPAGRRDRRSLADIPQVRGHRATLGGLNARENQSDGTENSRIHEHYVLGNRGIL